MSFISTTDQQTSLLSEFSIPVDSWENNIATIDTSGVYPRSIIFVSPDEDSFQLWKDYAIALYEQSYDTLTFRCSDTPTNKISGTVFILNDFNDAYESELKITDNYGNEISAGSTVNYGDKDTITLYIQTNRPGEIIAYTDNSNTSIKIFNNNILILSTSDPSKEDRITVKQRSCGEWESDVFIFYTRI